MDSRTIIDTAGAEKLLGRGDMLYAPVSANRPIRVQGAFVLDDDIKAVTDFIRSQENGASYDDIPLDLDEKFADAVTIALDLGQISTAALQRKLLLGYGRAARILDAMETLGVVGPPEGSKPRRVIITKAQAETLLAKLGQSRDTTPFDSDTEPLPVREKKPTPKPTNGTRRTTAEPAKKATAPAKALPLTQEVYTPSGIAAYEGDEPYIFVSYAHKDADHVLPVLRELSERGFRLWFDENIETGGKWTMEIMRHVKNCAAFLAFVTPSYAESSFCEREATTAMNKNKVMIALYLERFTEPDWLEFCFTLAQNIDCTRYANTTAYLNKLTASGEILKCRNT